MMRVQGTGGLGDRRAVARGVVSAIVHEPVRQAVPIVGKGSVNDIFVVATAASRFVVRVNDEASHAQFKKEAWCIAQASAAGIPSPQVLDVGTRGGHAYMVQTYVTGENGADKSADTTCVWRALGYYARIIHGIATDGFGEVLSPDRPGVFTDTWSRFLTYNIDSLTNDDPLLRLGVMTPTHAQKIGRVFRELREKPFRFALNHGDLALRNTLVERSGTVALLDWGCAEAHVVPHFDLIEIRRSSLAPTASGFAAFLDGYELSLAEYHTMLPDLDSLALLRAFDKLRWALDRKPERVPPFVRVARQAVQQKLGMH